ncbi:GNAT family N-acetyltransferase [Actinophytocola sp.]|uniref:GNAT family N-acetyltransferase n=1 Tax=Actinophytocola sp. TaxID=1872138 RepID=UPI0039C896A5
MSEVEIRQAQWEDLATLARTLGQKPFFADRLTRQDNALGVLLTAWADGAPIGDVYLWLDKAEEPEIREYLPDVPLLTHLEVVLGHRNHGVGTMLIDEAENLARARKHRHIALAVAVDNDKAAKLYDRLGYLNWSREPIFCYSLDFGDGERRAELCHVLVKPLTAPGS